MHLFAHLLVVEAQDDTLLLDMIDLEQRVGLITFVARFLPEVVTEISRVHSAATAVSGNETMLVHIAETIPGIFGESHLASLFPDGTLLCVESFLGVSVAAHFKGIDNHR